MTDRTDHRREAERLLADADEWAAQNYARSPEDGERACLAAAQVHALLAIHDTLTAADRYAANEAKQREGQMEDAWRSRDWETVERLQDEAEQREAPVISYEDIRQGMTIEATYSNGTRLRFVASRGYSTDSWADPSGCFQITPPGTEGLDPERVIRLIGISCGASPTAAGRGTLSSLNAFHGLLTFAPEADGAPSVTAPVADEGESGSVEGEGADDAPEALLCPECGHDIDRHAYDDDRAVDLCGECPDTERCPTPLPSQVARALIEQAVEQAGGRRG